MSDRTYGIVVVLDGPEWDWDTNVIERHVGWIGDGPSPRTACGKHLPKFKIWGINYPVESIPIAMGGRICPACQAATIAHAKRMDVALAQ